MGTDHKIYAITISKNYAKILDIAISENADYFEKWFIVTQEDDTDTIEVIKNENKPNIELIYYPLVPSKKQSNHAKSLLKGKYREITKYPLGYYQLVRIHLNINKKNLRKLKRKGLYLIREVLCAKFKPKYYQTKICQKTIWFFYLILI